MGGDNSPGNVVTTCRPCNFVHMGHPIEHLGLKDPRDRPPMVDEWDGLCRLLQGEMKTSGSTNGSGPTSKRSAGSQMRHDPAVGSSDVANWVRKHVAVDPQIQDELLKFTDAILGFGLNWRTGNVLVARIEVGRFVFDAFGISSTGEVYIPWYSTAPKACSHEFAAAVASAIPGAHVREGKSMWLVKQKQERPVDIGSFLIGCDAVSRAVENLRKRLVEVRTEQDGGVGGLTEPFQ